jgi:hypothetical protein
VVLLALGAWQTGGLWGNLWLLVPLTAATSILLAWRFGAWATGLPLAVLGVSAASLPHDPLWMGWLPAAALTGVWIGLREESGTTLGQRMWMLLPLLAVAAALPWAAGYARAVDSLEEQMAAMDGQVMDFYRQLGLSADRLQALQGTLRESAELRTRALPNALPTVLFVWVALLVQAGRATAARVAGWLRWPAMAPGRLAELRLPDAVLWLLLLGLALLVTRIQAWTPTAYTLTAAAALGYCLQGVSVIQSLMLARGFSPYLVAVLIAFVLVMAPPAFVLLVATVGVSDVWLDFRKLESPESEAS